MAVNFLGQLSATTRPAVVFVGEALAVPAVSNIRGSVSPQPVAPIEEEPVVADVCLCGLVVGTRLHCGTFRAFRAT